MAQALGYSGVYIGFAILLISGAPAQDTWVIIHFLQLVLVLPLMVISMNKTVKEFIVSNAFTASSVYVLPLTTIQSIQVISDISFHQPDEYLSSLGWTSGSTLVNNFMSFTITTVIGIVHLILYLTKNIEHRYSSMVMKIYEFFTYTLYIRIVIELYMFSVLMLVSEIKYYFKNGGDDNFGHQGAGEEKGIRGNYVLFFFSFIMLILALAFSRFAYISWKRNKGKIKIDDKCKT